MPSFPQPFDKLSGTVVADGAQIVSLHVENLESPRLQLNIIGSDEAASAQFAAVTSALFRAIQQKTTELPIRINDDTRSLLGRTMPKHNGNRVSIDLDSNQGDIGLLAAAIKPVVDDLVIKQERVNRSNVIRAIGLATHNYHDANKSLPAYANFDATGKPLLSWRVLILPFLDGSTLALYKQFRLDEPWDSEHNRKLIGKMPKIYATDPELSAEGKTVFTIPRGTELIGQNPGLSLEKIMDGTSMTILLAQAAKSEAMIWTKPDDWQVDLANPKSGLFSAGQNSTVVAFADCSVHSISDQIDEKTLKALLTINGSEYVPHEQIK